MTAENKLKSTKEKKRRPAPPEEFVEYIVEITGWFWEYSLSLSSGRYRDHDPYCESRDLQITGKLLRPTGLNLGRISGRGDCRLHRALRMAIRLTVLVHACRRGGSGSQARQAR